MVEDEVSKPGSPPAVRLALKVVPGSRRDQIVGAYGERLKVKVAAPAEDGRANRAVCELLAGALGVSARNVEVVAGFASAEKVVRVSGVTAGEVKRALGV